MSLVKRILGLKRYYIVYYNFSVDSGIKNGSGSITVMNDSGRMFNMNWLIDEAKNSLVDLDGNDYKVVITGFNELSKSDFNDYIKEK